MHDKTAENVEYFVDLALHASNRALNLLDSLLTWTVSQNMAKAFNPETFNLYELVDDEVDIMSDSALQKNILLESKIPREMQIKADRQMIRTVIRNLINNAIKFTNRGGNVEISATMKEQYAEIVVSDTGIGMTPEVQNKLFCMESFHSTIGTNREVGTGLGLLICKDFMERHGGFIDVESNPGAGSRFKCILPSCGG
jgi:signal transduction histidine kinase